MSDFMKWLYASYIKPQIDAVPRKEYESDFYLLEDDIAPETLNCFSKTQEFTAVHAFLLGLRTGQGLAESVQL